MGYIQKESEPAFENKLNQKGLGEKLTDKFDNQIARSYYSDPEWVMLMILPRMQGVLIFVIAAISTTVQEWINNAASAENQFSCVQISTCYCLRNKSSKSAKYLKPLTYSIKSTYLWIYAIKAIKKCLHETQELGKCFNGCLWKM
ncbi:hypothetical protein NPIL_500751 [Nephila pilipes]|uniref:Uncharacterized protein n=1 Tax=Nephila pilipes TaxID=299642 RepID=A0A8X6KBN5_NEPPI|nr:hypothetical protein NPIL_500751 [Nephila pilipes]